MATKSNPLTPADLRAIGATAMANAQKADVMGKKARADMTYVIGQALDTEVHCFYQTADKTTIVNSWERVRDLLDQDYVASICGDTAKAISATCDAVIQELTGVDKPTAAQRDCFKAAREAARGLLAKLGDSMPERLRRTAKGNIQVPYDVMHNPPKADAPESEHDTWEARKNSMFTIDGSRGNSFAELKSRVAIKKPDDRANSGQGKVAPTTWLEAVKAKIGKATWQGHKGMDWVAYMADLSGEELIEAMVLYSAHKGDSE